MGLLRFLSPRKSSPKPTNIVKAQAYDTTTASLPPLLGAYPVAGNGPPNVFQNLHHKMSETDLSLAGGSEASAPAPSVPRIRDGSVERPRSAPNGAGPGSSPLSRRRRGSLQGSLLSPRKPQGDSITSVRSGLSPAPRRGRQPPAIPYDDEPFRPPTGPFAHTRHFSVQSASSTARGFIDILDAQSEIKPSGFQNRVRAAGVRDYGEDVADRNIGENGVDLASEKVQAFYALNNGSPRDRRDDPRFPVIARATFGNTFGNKERSHSSSWANNDLVGVEARTKSLTSGSLGQSILQTAKSPERWHGQDVIFEDVSESPRRRRRQSLGSLIPTTPSPGPRSLHQSAVDMSVSPIARRRERRSTTSGEAPFGIYARSISHSANAETPLSPRTCQKPVYTVKHNYSLPVQQRPKTSGQPQTETYYAVRPPSRGGSVASPTFSSPTQKSPSQQHKLSAGASSRHVEWSQDVKFDEGSDTRGWVGRIEVESSLNSADVSSPAPSPHVMRSGRSWHESQDDSEQQSINLGSPTEKSKTDEFVPMRTSSLRRGSMSSVTPTLSSSSSFKRPPSRHTTSTSVDLATMSSFMNDSRSSLHSGSGDQKSFYTANETAVSSPLDGVVFGAGFSIDDYLSSDDDVDADSFITTRRHDSVHGATNEEALLFCDSGYGNGGMQLPGLFDSITHVPHPVPTTPSSSEMRYSHSSPSPSPIRFHRRLSLSPRFETPTFVFDDDNWDGADGYDILPVRADLALGRRGTRRLSALGTRYQSIEEENEDKVDVRTAVRLRKEAKARQRAMGRPGRAQKQRASSADEAHHSNPE